MKRRTALKLMGAAGASASVSGCSGILGGCGPGETEIGAVAGEFTATDETPTATVASPEDREAVSITGTVQSVGDGDIVLDDGTGAAKLTNLYSRTTAETVGSGDCVQARGIPFAPESGGDYDVRLLVDGLGPADD
jgi:hypothetical protein